MGDERLVHLGHFEIKQVQETRIFALERLE